jgi:uncharacterized hydrophobic protein (TIGR00271 family)
MANVIKIALKVFYGTFNLHSGEDVKQKTLDNVKSNVSFTGANLWILACAILVASVGLNVNSTAVIIGAMLISPLMGPILAAGFSLAIYDFSLLKRALRNLFVATFVSLFVATLYFYISPFKEIQSELLARTSPNIYDILIAFFGGLVGVIAVTRVEKGNVIPGVAIATALMPPLCTAGYGLAIGNFTYFLGAFFLYTINCVFICIATFVIVKFLKYPAKEQVDIKHQRQIKYSITALTLLMLIPSCYFAFTLFKKQQFTQNVNNYIEKEFVDKGNTVVYKKTDYNPLSSSIELAFLSRHYTDSEINLLNTKLTYYNIKKAKLVIKQNDNLQVLKNDILNEVNKSEDVLSEKDRHIKELETVAAKNTFDEKGILKETQAVFPTINGLSLANHTVYFPKDSTEKITVLLYKADKDLTPVEKVKIKNWLQEKLSVKKIAIYKEP